MFLSLTNVCLRPRDPRHDCRRLVEGQGRLLRESEEAAGERRRRRRRDDRRRWGRGKTSVGFVDLFYFQKSRPVEKKIISGAKFKFLNDISPFLFCLPFDLKWMNVFIEIISLNTLSQRKACLLGDNFWPTWQIGHFISRAAFAEKSISTFINFLKKCFNRYHQRISWKLVIFEEYGHW